MGLGYYGDSVDALVIGRNYRTVSATKIADCLSRVEVSIRTYGVAIPMRGALQLLCEDLRRHFGTGRLRVIEEEWAELPRQ